MTYGSETMPLLVDVGLKFERAEIRIRIPLFWKYIHTYMKYFGNIYMTWQ